MDCATTTVRNEGGLALYQGYTITFCSTPLYVGLQMSLYDVFKARAPKDPETGKATMLGSFFAGASAVLTTRAHRMERSAFFCFCFFFRRERGRERERERERSATMRAIRRNEPNESNEQKHSTKVQTQTPKNYRITLAHRASLHRHPHIGETPSRSKCRATA